MRGNYLFTLASLSTIHLSAHTGSGSALHTIYEFPNETWVENLAIRSNGKILTTIIGKPEVWEVDPTTRTAELVYSFPNATSALGITEIGPDIFAVAVGNFSITTVSGTPGTWSIWTVDLSHHRSHEHPYDSVAKVDKLVAIPQATFLNGMTTLPIAPHTIFIGDAAFGIIYKLNTLIGAYSVALDYPALKPNTSAPFLLGVNGIQAYGEDNLYFTNSFQPPFLARSPFNANGSASGPLETILAKTPFPTNLGFQADDFALDAEGNAWITGDPSNHLVKVTPTGVATKMVGGVNSTAIAGATAAHFGRTWKTRNTLYITTNGGMAYPPPGGVVGGKVIAFDTSAYQQVPWSSTEK